MNKRIKELADQAGFPVGQRNRCFAEFAELIVLECVDKVKNADMTDLEGPDYEDVLWLVEKQIKQHFGVEE